MLKMYGLIFICLLFACKQEEKVEPVESKDEKTSLRFLALGDSYTIGEGVEEKHRWPVQLTDSLVNDGVVTEDTTQIIAITGWTTRSLLNGIKNDKPGEDYNLVSLLIGVNNYYQGRTVEEYEKEFVQLLDSAIKFAGGNKENVFVVSIPDYAYTPFGNGSETISEGIDLFNASNKRLTDSVGVDYINITPISRRGLDEPDLVAGDNLHPSGKQYSLWIEEMYATVKQKFD